MKPKLQLLESLAVATILVACGNGRPADETASSAQALSGQQEGVNKDSTHADPARTDRKVDDNDRDHHEEDDVDENRHDDSRKSTQELSLLLPPHALPQDITLSANGTLTMGAKVRLPTYSNPQTVSNMGEGPTKLGVAVEVGNVWSEEPIFVSRSARVGVDPVSRTPNGASMLAESEPWQDNERNTRSTSNVTQCG